MRAHSRRLSLVVGTSDDDCVHDDVLMQRAQAGSTHAFDQLVRRHQARVLRIAARYSNDVSLAPDIAQNALIELYRTLPRYEARGQFLAYLCRITINQCRIEGRRRKYGVEPRGSDDTAQRALFDTASDLPYALAQLSDKLREVVVLRYSGDLDLAEIADALEIPLGTVKRRLFDATAKLRQTLKGDV